MYYADDDELSYYDKFRTYKIVKGDTLQGVAEKLGVEARELRRYHNMHCQLPDLIEVDFKRYSKFLILAPEKNDAASADTVNTLENKQKRAALGKENKLPFLPNGICKDYSVEYTFKVGNKVDTMGMAVRVKWKAMDSKYNLFEIQRSINLFVDNNTPDIIIDKCSSKLVEVLYPLEIIVDETGKWIDIYNYDEIVSRWKNKKSEFSDHYKKDAAVVQHLITFTEDALKSSDQLIMLLSSDYLLKSFFNGIHTSYTSDYSLDREISFPLEKNKKSVFKVQQSINPYLNDTDLIEVEQKGDYLNFEDGIDFSGKFWEGKYNARYCLDSFSGFLETMNLECSIEYEEPIKISLIVEALKKEETK